MAIVTTLDPDPVVRTGPTSSLRVLVVLSALMAFASISTDLYLPALPTMGASIGASIGTMELTISGYLVGFSVGQLLWGPIGDRYGRRLPVAIGLVLFVLGSAGCALSTSGATLIAWRILQAVGACASVVLARAMVRDLYEGSRAAKMLSTLMTVMAIAPLIGPSIGSLILHVASWRSIFGTLVGVGIATLAALYTLPETLAPERRNREPLHSALKRYGDLLQDRNLVAYAGASGFFYAGVYAYIAGTPFAYIDYYHVSPSIYGLLFAAGIAGIMAMNTVNTRLVTRLGIDRSITIGAFVTVVTGAMAVLNAWTGWGGLAGLAMSLFLFVSANGLIVANSIAGAMNTAPQRAGTVSALIGAIQYGSGIAGSAWLGLFADGTPRPMAGVMLLAGIGSLFFAKRLSSVTRPLNVSLQEK